MKKDSLRSTVSKFIVTILAVSCLFFNIGCGDSLAGFLDYDSSAVSAAQQIVKNNLKNPSSAIFNTTRVELKDDYRRYIVYVDVSAQNGFGGYTRERYWVGLRLAEDGETYWYFPNMPYFSADVITAESAKNMFFTDWGQEPQE